MGWNRTVLLGIEARFRAAGFTLLGFCHEADINPTSWKHWKTGRDGKSIQPHAKTWAKVERAIRRIEAKRAKAA